MSVESRILAVLARELDLTLEELREEEEISMAAVPEWDSLKHTQVILSLEREFGTTFPPARASQAATLQALTEMVESART